MDVSFHKKNCGAERERKRKKKWQIVLWQGFCQNRGKKKNFATFFFPSISAPQFFLRNDTFTIFSQHFYKKS